jgi:hypothetical protein
LWPQRRRGEAGTWGWAVCGRSDGAGQQGVATPGRYSDGKKKHATRGSVRSAALISFGEQGLGVTSGCVDGVERSDELTMAILLSLHPMLTK